MREIKFGSVYEEVKVNENGDTIKIPVGDNIFKDNYVKMLSGFEDMRKEIAEKNIKLKEGVEDVYELIKIDHALEDEYTGKICAMIDELFGENTLKKCYPDAAKPNLTTVADFFSLITPEIADIYSEREMAISTRYNQRRKGAHSK